MFNLNFMVLSIILSAWFSISGAQEELKSGWVGRYACAQHKNLANIFELDIELEQQFNVDSRIYRSDLKFSFNKVMLVGLSEAQKVSAWPFMLNDHNVKTIGLIHLKENTDNTNETVNQSQLKLAGKLTKEAKNIFNINLLNTGRQTFSAQISSNADLKTLKTLKVPSSLLKHPLICTKMVQSSRF